MNKFNYSRRLRLINMTSASPTSIPGAQWDSPLSRNFDYRKLSDWKRYCKVLEDARFDAIFFLDHSAIDNTYQGSYATTLREAVNAPLTDPMILSAVLAQSTTNLGFASSANIIQDHPYAFARRLSAIDLVTEGRISWNIVTSVQAAAWKNLGYDDIAPHSERYKRAEEYMQVLYKLLNCWEDSAVVRDIEKRMYADASKVHPINHEGDYYRVPGIHTAEPTPQRIPFLFQAGTSEDGRAFAARNAEAMFIDGVNVKGAKLVVDDMEKRLIANGRRREDMLIFSWRPVLVASTEAELKQKIKDTNEWLSDEAGLAFFSGVMNFDFSSVDLEAPISKLETEGLKGTLAAFAAAAPDKSWTVRELVTMVVANNRIEGTPEQVADTFQEWHEAGLDGMNIGSVAGWEDTAAFAEHVVPILQKRGVVQTEYAPGTLREKMFYGTESQSPYPNERHASAKYKPVNAA